MKAKLRGTTGLPFDVIEVPYNVYEKLTGKEAIPFTRYYADEEGTIYKDAELDFNLDPPHPEVTISGWVCRDKEICEQYNTDLWVGTFKPIRKLDTYWAASKAALIPISPSLFPSLTWQDEPIEVEIQIKPKKQ